jgi:hypothetical protein
VHRDLTTMGDERWESASLVPVVIKARPVTTRMRFYLVMKCSVKEQVVDALPELRQVTDNHE